MSDNMAQEIEYFKELTKPFSQDELKRHPRGFDYITARTVQLRLDKVCGPARWTIAYDELKQGGVKCTLSIQSPNGEWYQRDAMAGPSSHMNDTCDAVKASCSEAFKVAASNFGIGRELYGDGETYYPGEAAPPKPEKPKVATPASKPKPATDNKKGRPPKAGNPKAPYAWLKNLEEKFGEEVVKSIGRKMEDSGRSWDTRTWDDGDIEFARSMLYEQFSSHPSYDGCLDPEGESAPVPQKSSAADQMQAMVSGGDADRDALRHHAVDAVTALLEWGMYKVDDYNLAKAAEELVKKATGKAMAIKSLSAEMRVPLLKAVVEAAENLLMTGEGFTFETLTS